MSVEAGTLYLVPTPIGNVEDLSPRARAVICEVDVVASEDTRTTKALLTRLALRCRGTLLAYHDHNERQRVPELIRRLQNGQSVAVVSEAGTPLVSDPGFQLVRAAAQAGIPMDPLPGPCAATTALSASGLPSDRFAFIGFLARQEGKRRAAMADLAELALTTIYYEAPRRLVPFLADALHSLGDRQAVVAVNLTKQGQAFHRGSLSQLHQQFAAQDEIRGEITVLIEGAEPDEAALWAQAEPHIRRMAEQGVSPGLIRDVITDLTGLPRRAVYQKALEHG